MDEQQYLELLKKGKSNLPEIKAAARFEIPRVSVMTTKRQVFVRSFIDLAKALRREPKHVARYLFKELAMPGAIQGNELIMQGKSSEGMVNRRIEDYVKEFVICEECKKPDTNIAKEGGVDILKCEACGARRSLRKI
ncbi:MAG TPA: translation initiation factor IF-2 subunit beta [archaeon]|nr:translation initiation factor IF-2 subunit beta [archaeon]